MSACCRRLTASAAASPVADHPNLRRPSSSVSYLQPSQSWQRRDAGWAVLRSRRLVLAAAVAHWGEEEEDEMKKTPVPPPRCSSFDRDAAAMAKKGNEKGRADRKADVVVAAAATVVLGVGNRVLYKLALVPLKHYPFFLAQLATFGYVIIYFSILYLRYQAGKVTDEMLSLPKAPLIAVGLLEALAAASGMAAGAILSGAAIPILSQSFLVWQLVFSYIFLGRRYRFNQLFGCFLVAVGVIVTVASGSGPGSLMEAGIFWSILMIISFLLQAADTVLKETIFLDAAKRLKGGKVDLFVVNSFGSAYQAVFICLLLPFLSNLWGIPFAQLPSYLKDGAACFLNVGTMSNSYLSSHLTGICPFLCSSSSFHSILNSKIGEGQRNGDATFDGVDEVHFRGGRGCGALPRPDPRPWQEEPRLAGHLRDRVGGGGAARQPVVAQSQVVATIRGGDRTGIAARSSGGGPRLSVVAVVVFD